MSIFGTGKKTVVDPETGIRDGRTGGTPRTRKEPNVTTDYRPDRDLKKALDDPLFRNEIPNADINNSDIHQLAAKHLGKTFKP